MSKVTKHFEFGNTSNIAMHQAKKILEKLPGGFPSFAKLMQPSNVTTNFYLCLPAKFCKTHLSQCDQKIVLEYEDGQNYETMYLAKYYTLTGGWKAFAKAHQLAPGDLLIFRKIMPLMFKVIMVRAKDLTQEEEEEEEAVALSLHSLSSSEQIIAPGVTVSSSRQQAAERPTSPLLLWENNYTHVNSSNGGFSSSVLDHLVSKYYELCCAQKLYLHQHLVGKYNSILIAGIITQVTTISDSIRSSNLNTPHDALREWDKQLASFERLGMEVRFLREQLFRLIHLAYNPDTEVESTRITEATCKKEDLISKVMQMNQTIN